MSNKNRTEKRIQYQAFINTEPVGPRLGSKKAVRKWLRSFRRKANLTGSVSDETGFLLEKEPSRFIDDKRNCPILNGPAYAGLLYEIKVV